MHTEVNAFGQMNVEINNVMADEAALDSLRVGLEREYPEIENLVFKLDGELTGGKRYTVRFVVPGPMLFQNECQELLYSIGLVRWSIRAEAGPKGQPGFF